MRAGGVYTDERESTRSDLTATAAEPGGWEGFRWILTRMVTLMALFMLPLYSQPCLEIPPFWEPSEAVSWSRGERAGDQSHTNTAHHIKTSPRLLAAKASANERSPGFTYAVEMSLKKPRWESLRHIDMRERSGQDVQHVSGRATKQNT